MARMLSSEALTRRIASVSPNSRSRVKNLADQDSAQLPLRPLAPAPQRSASTSTTSSPGSCSLSMMAVHRPV